MIERLKNYVSHTSVGHNYGKYSYIGIDSEHLSSPYYFIATPKGYAYFQTGWRRRTYFYSSDALWDKLRFMECLHYDVYRFEGALDKKEVNRLLMAYELQR